MAANPFSGLFSKSGEPSSGARVGNPFDGMFVKAPPKPLITPITQVQQQAKQKQQNQNKGFFDKLGNDIGDVATTGAKVAVGTAKTIAKPAVTIGKAVINTPKAIGREIQDKPINDIQQKVFGTTGSGSIARQTIGDLGQIGANFIGVGEAKDALQGTAAADEAVNAAEDVSKVNKVVNATKVATPVVASGGASGASNVVASKEKLTPENIAVGTVEGAGTAAAGFAGGKVIKAGISKIFNHVPTPEVDTTPTKIPVTDESTGTTKGTVSNKLPVSTGAGKIPVTSTAQPSDAGFSDAEFRSTFKAPALKVAKNTPAVLDTAAKANTNDALTAVTAHLANTTSAKKAAPIVDQLIPGLSGAEKNAVVKQVVSAKNVDDVADALYNGSKNHEATQTGNAALIGTPMDKSISFDNPSDVENGQRQQLHVRIGQINKALAAHEDGSIPQSTQYVKAIRGAKQTAQDVLDSKTDYNTAYSQKPVLSPVKPLPFVGDSVDQAGPVRSVPMEALKSYEGAPDKNQVEQYKSDIAAGKPIEPLLVSRDSSGQLGIEDGKHRFEAMKQSGITNASVIDVSKNAPKSVLDDLPEVAGGDKSRQAEVNRRSAMATTNNLFHEAEAKAAYKKLAPGDIKVLEQLETKDQMSPEAEASRATRIINANAKKPAALQKYYNIVRGDLNTALTQRQALHPETGKLSNYFQHFYDRSDPNTASKLQDLAEQKARILKQGAPGYSKHRIIDTYADSDRLGLKRANANLHEDYLQTIHQTVAENGRAALIKGLKEAHGEGSVSNYVGKDAVSGLKFDQLKIPGGDNLTMPEELATHYNARAAAKPATNLLVKGYDKLNKGTKNVVLAGGAFHGTQSALTIAGQQLINGIRHPLDLVDNLRLIGDTMSSKLRNAHMVAMNTNHGDFKDGLTSIQRQRLSGLTYTDLASKATDGKSQGILNKLPVFKQLHTMVFDRQLPAAKQMIFDQKTAKLDLTNPSDLLKARKIAGGINYMIGGVDSATQGLSPANMQRLSRVVLAADYTEGRAMTVVNALTKFGKNSPEGKLARQAVVGKSIVTALPGLIALTASGKLNPKDPVAVGNAFIQQVIDPQIPTGERGAPTQSNPKGNPISLKLPSTYISEIGKILSPAIDPSDTYDDSRTSGLKEFASSRLAALPSAVEKLATNTDFYGKPIVTGGPKQTAENVAAQFSPIPISQGTKTATGNQSVQDAIANEIGLRASTSTLPSPDLTHAQRLNEFYNTKFGINDNVRAPLIKQINTLISQGQTQQAKRLAINYNNSLNQRLMPFRTKYANNYNPAFDKSFLEDLPIKTSGDSFSTRLTNAKDAKALLQ